MSASPLKKETLPTTGGNTGTSTGCEEEQKKLSHSNKQRWTKMLRIVGFIVLFLCGVQFFLVLRDPARKSMQRPERFIRNGTKRIAVLTIVGDTAGMYSWMWPMSYHSKKEYCKRNGYDLIVGGPEDIEKARTSHWSKLTMLLKWLPHYDYILWQDGDAIFTNYDIRLESLIPEGKYLVMSHDYNNINSGVFILKNTEWSFNFVRECLNVPLDQIWYPFFHEQSAIIQVLYHNPQHWEHIYSPPQRSFNAYPEALTHWFWGKDAIWHPGDFIVHTPNCRSREGLCRPAFEEAYRQSARTANLPTANPKPPLHEYPMEIPPSPPYWR